MITGVCLNPCIDKTVEIDGFSFAGMNRILSSRMDGAGKGVNIALVAREFGMAGHAIGMIYPGHSRLVTDKLDAAGASHEFIQGVGDIRVNLKIFDRKTQTITEVNEPGQAMDEGQMAQMKALVGASSKASKYMVFTGSLPPGAPEDLYFTLMQQADAGCQLVLDAEGKKLKSGLAAHPFLIKPNTYELEMLVGHKLGSLEEILAAAKACVFEGAKYVAVSMGADGALLTDGRQSFYAPRVPVEVRSTVGAGDSVVGGLLYGFSQGLPLKEILRCGAAAGTAAVTTQGTQLFSRAQFDEYLPLVRVEAI